MQIVTGELAHIGELRLQREWITIARDDIIRWIDTFQEQQAAGLFLHLRRRQSKGVAPTTPTRSFDSAVSLGFVNELELTDGVLVAGIAVPCWDDATNLTLCGEFLSPRFGSYSTGGNRSARGENHWARCLKFLALQDEAAFEGQSNQFSTKPFHHSLATLS